MAIPVKDYHYDMDYVIVDIKYPEGPGSESVAETETKSRMERLSGNIKKAGSFEKLEEAGGKEKIAKYVEKTAEIAETYLAERVMGDLLTTKEDIDYGIGLMKKVNIPAIVKSGDITLLEKTADDLRGMFVEKWCENISKRHREMKEAENGKM